MLASINPLGERGRNQHYPVTVVTFIVSATVAGAFLGGVLGLVGARFVPRRANDIQPAKLHHPLAGLWRITAQQNVGSPPRHVGRNRDCPALAGLRHDASLLGILPGVQYLVGNPGGSDLCAQALRFRT